MVEVIAEDLFQQEMRKAVAYAMQEFGGKCAAKWNSGTRRILRNLSVAPEAYPPVPELYDVWPRFRGAPLMRNFKVIYHYNEEERKVYVNDLWDMRQDPRKLKSRWRKYPIA